MEAILDSNFIISCIKRNIDFLSQLEEKGFRVLIPREVLQELKDLRLKVSHDNRVAIDLALEIFTKKKFEKMKLGRVSVDEGLISKGKMGAYIASLDKAIKRQVPNRIFINNARNSIEVVRG